MRPKKKAKDRPKTFLKFARLEPTVDQPFIDKRIKDGKKRFDVVIYDDPDCTEPYARFMWYTLPQPKPGQATTMINCYRWQLEWKPTIWSRSNASDTREN